MKSVCFFFVCLSVVLFRTVHGIDAKPHWADVYRRCIANKTMGIAVVETLARGLGVPAVDFGRQNMKWKQFLPVYCHRLEERLRLFQPIQCIHFEHYGGGVPLWADRIAALSLCTKLQDVCIRTQHVLDRVREDGENCYQAYEQFLLQRKWQRRLEDFAEQINVELHATQVGRELLLDMWFNQKIERLSVWFDELPFYHKSLVLVACAFVIFHVWNRLTFLDTPALPPPA